MNKPYYEQPAQKEMGLFPCWKWKNRYQTIQGLASSLPFVHWCVCPVSPLDSSAVMIANTPHWTALLAKDAGSWGFRLLQYSLSSRLHPTEHWGSHLSHTLCGWTETRLWAKIVWRAKHYHRNMTQHTHTHTLTNLYTEMCLESLEEVL